MLKSLITFLTLTSIGQLKAQQTENFEYWISSLDKAANKRVTYHIASMSIEIKDGPYDFVYFAKNNKKDETIFKCNLDSVGKKDIYKISLTLNDSTLKSLYTNLCVIDGTILHFHFEWDNKKLSSTLSNYYLDTIKPFVDFVNSRVPEKYKIYYDKTYLEQLLKDCPKDRILD